MLDNVTMNLERLAAKAIPKVRGKSTYRHFEERTLPEPECSATDEQRKE
jgi:hypothetical protein